MRASAKSFGSLRFTFRSAFGRQPEPEWRPGRVSPEERIAAVLIVVLLATLVAAACAVYVLNRDKARVTSGANAGILAAWVARAAKTLSPKPP
jgi:hypothetical protein